MGLERGTRSGMAGQRTKAGLHEALSGKRAECPPGTRLCHRRLHTLCRLTRSSSQLSRSAAEQIESPSGWVKGRKSHSEEDAELGPKHLLRMHRIASFPDGGGDQIHRPAILHLRSERGVRGYCDVTPPGTGVEIVPQEAYSEHMLVPHLLWTTGMEKRRDTNEVSLLQAAVLRRPLTVHRLVKDGHQEKNDPGLSVMLRSHKASPWSLCLLEKRYSIHLTRYLYTNLFSCLKKI